MRWDGTVGLPHAKEENCSWSLCFLSAQQPILAHGALEKTNHISSALVRGQSLSSPTAQFCHFRCKNGPDVDASLIRKSICWHSEEPGEYWPVNEMACRSGTERWRSGSLCPDASFSRYLYSSPQQRASPKQVRDLLEFVEGSGRKLVVLLGGGQLPQHTELFPFPLKSGPCQPRTF